MKMKIRPVNVFGDPVPGVTVEKVAEPGEGAFRIKIGAPGHLPRFRIVFDNQWESDAEVPITLLIDPKTIEDAPELERACHANILAKMDAVEVAGDPLTAWLSDREPVELRQDRCFLWVEPSLSVVLDKTSAFGGAPGGLHPSPDGFERGGSWKTSADKRAGLQVVLHHNDDEIIGEFDIDLRTGIAHWFEALGNEISGSKTNPYIVAQLLLQQGIDPGYTFRAGS
jgi:hypothetical protein